MLMKIAKSEATENIWLLHYSFPSSVNAGRVEVVPSLPSCCVDGLFSWLLLLLLLLLLLFTLDGGAGLLLSLLDKDPPGLLPLWSSRGVVVVVDSLVPWSVVAWDTGEHLPLAPGAGPSGHTFGEGAATCADDSDDFAADGDPFIIDDVVIGSALLLNRCIYFY